MSGTIVVLNGAAGAGKTSIARAIQESADEPYLNAGIDHFLGLLPARYLQPPLWQDVMGMHDRPGSAGARLMAGMHHAIAAISRQDMAVVADHVLVEPGWLAECARLFDGLPAYLVGVHCPLHVLRQRERDRPDRQATPGEVDRQFAIVHVAAAYDVEVDTSDLSAAEAATLIGEHLRRYPPRAFRLRLLFEHAPTFMRRLLAQPSVEQWPAFLDRAEAVAHEMPEAEQVELLDAHPRIGAAAGSLSALSYREQGYEHDSGTAELQQRLNRLNDDYERRFGFRFVIFVAGRSRTEIAELMPRFLDADRPAELRRGLTDVIAIARDRLSKLAPEEDRR